MIGGVDSNHSSSQNQLFLLGLVFSEKLRIPALSEWKLPLGLLEGGYQDYGVGCSLKSVNTSGHFFRGTAALTRLFFLCDLPDRASLSNALFLL